MAAGQEKKRLNAANLVSCNLKEQYRAKKKKNVESSQNVLNTRPCISLDWDVTQKKAVAKREQIGITWRDIAPFINSGCRSNRGLADVFPIPREIFGLEDLTGVLSLEVWETVLSESERKLLAQFLPRGTDVDQVVQALLLGDNLHFGNSFIIWGTSLCSGNVQPDAVLSRDQGFMANKKAYYSELQKYHTDMIKNLQKLKDIWMHSKDPEKDFVEEMWRHLRKHSENSLSCGNESKECDLQENIAGAADSCFQLAGPKLPISNKRIVGKKGGEPQQSSNISSHGAKVQNIWN